ncbi:methyltransferase domain-containing protein [Algibacter lectus]|uniref:methyltransferase domain-containing protein n=1 Tax=Algibacter lectus TaxID=221126 RepID=UPI00293739EB|nr:methyltransferase domain-containing protein [Algibacter lectus]
MSPPLKAYFDGLTNKDLKILIPGGGNSHEAEYLHNKGFKHVYVIDLSKTALENLKLRVPSFPENHLIHGNFFDIDMVFDIIMEQTFFCAINPNLRHAYAEKAFNLLNKTGLIIGLLFNVPLNETRPPFGGSKAEYLEYFKPYFDVSLMNGCYNSHQTRAGRELFIRLKKLDH